LVYDGGLDRSADAARANITKFNIVRSQIDWFDFTVP